MRKIISLLSVFVVLCGVMSLPGIAQAKTSIDAQGAESLKKQIEDSLQWRFDMAKALGQGFAMEGDIKVTPKDTFYEIITPKLSVALGLPGKLDIGTITAKAKPDPSGGWLTDVTLSSPITFYDRSNTPVAHITIGTQQFSGIWMPDNEMYSKFNSHYQDILIKSVASNLLTVSIDSIKARLNLKDHGDGTWSGPNDYEIAGVKINASGKSKTNNSAKKMLIHLDIGKILASNAYKRMNVRQTLEVKKELQDFFKSKTPITEEARAEILNTILSKSEGLVGDISSSSEINNFSLIVENLDPLQPSKKIFFNKFAFRGASDGFGKEKAAFNIKSSLNGFKISFSPTGLEGLVPESFNIEINVADLPLKEIMAMLVKVGVEANKETSEPAKMNVTASLSSMLQDSGFSITIKDTFVKSPDLNVDIKGKIKAIPAPPLGAIGTITLSLKGLDETVKKLQAIAVKPDTNPQIMSYAGILSLFQMMGEVSSTADGVTLRNYVFALTPDGKLLLNNKYFSTLTSSIAKRPGSQNAAPSRMTPPAP